MIRQLSADGLYLEWVNNCNRPHTIPNISYNGSVYRIRSLAVSHSISLSADLSIHSTLVHSTTCFKMLWMSLPFSPPEASPRLVSTKNSDLWEGPTPSVRDSWAARHSVHAQSQVRQIWLAKSKKKISEHAQKFGSGGADHKEGGLWGREMSRYVSLTEWSTKWRLWGR